jgi:hypothetical protein
MHADFVIFPDPFVSAAALFCAPGLALTTLHLDALPQVTEWCLQAQLMRNPVEAISPKSVAYAAR